MIISLILLDVISVGAALWLLIVVTLVGHDGTYGSTVYARHFYHPEDIIPDRRFVDVMSQLPDGRLLIDYEQFHDTVPDTAEPPEHPVPAAH